MLKKPLRIVSRVCLLGVWFLIAGACGEGDDDGACDCFSETDHCRYCIDDMTSEECSDFDRRNVNGGGWSYYGGQTCEERGCASGGPCGCQWAD